MNGRRVFPASSFSFGALPWLALTLLVCLPAPALWAEVQVPFLEGRVVDLAGMISPNAKVEIDTELQNLEAATGAQVVVLVVPTLDGEVIENFSLRVVETWKLGQKGQDNGVLLLIARDDRRMRIEVGYGLEGALPDVLCSRILNERLTPRFKAGDFDGGIRDAVTTIGAVVRGEPGAMPEPSDGGGGVFSGIILLFVVGLVVFNAIVPIVLSAVHSKVMGWIIYPLVAIPAFLVPTVTTGNPTFGIVGVVVWLVLFPLLKMFSAHLPKTLGSGRVSWSSTSGWSSGSSGRSGGGGFSGGGGSFGGGGASGSW